VDNLIGEAPDIVKIADGDVRSKVETLDN